jgi:hypothetical protein
MKPKLDAGDLEDLQDTLRSPGYGQIREHLERVIAATMRELVKPSAAERTAQLRGQIEGLQVALDVPGELLRQIKAEIARAKPNA